MIHELEKVKMKCTIHCEQNTNRTQNQLNQQNRKMQSDYKNRYRIREPYVIGSTAKIECRYFFKTGLQPSCHKKCICHKRCQSRLLKLLVAVVPMQYCSTLGTKLFWTFAGFGSEMAMSMTAFAQSICTLISNLSG